MSDAVVELLRLHTELVGAIRDIQAKMDRDTRQARMEAVLTHVALVALLKAAPPEARAAVAARLLEDPGTFFVPGTALPDSDRAFLAEEATRLAAKLVMTPAPAAD